MTRRWQDRRLLIPVLAVALILTFVVALQRVTHQGTQITGLFARTVGLYPGDDVRVLGVKVGRVDEIVASAGSVRVKVTLDDGVDVPASAQMVIVAPSLVSGRYVQFSPAWKSGPTLRSGAVLDTTRTSVPVEWDELKSALDNFATDLGPDSPDGSSPLGRALDTTSANLDGRGTSINGTIKELSTAVDVLSRNRGDIYATVNNLATFTKTLRDSDQQIRLFADQITTMTTLLASNRKDLTTAVSDLRTLMPELQAYLKTDGPLLTDDLKALKKTTDILVRRRQEVADALQTSPVSLSNTQAMYDAKTRSVTAGLVFPYVESPQQIVCFLISRVVSDPGACAGLLKLFPFLDTSQGGAAQTAAPGDVTSLLTPAARKATP